MAASNGFYRHQECREDHAGDLYPSGAGKGVGWDQQRNGGEQENDSQRLLKLAICASHSPIGVVARGEEFQTVTFSEAATASPIMPAGEPSGSMVKTSTTLV